VKMFRVFVGTLLVVAASAPPATAAASTRATCEFRGMRTVAANREAVLLKDRAGYAGCLRSSGRRVFLAEFEGDRPPNVGVLNGHFAASNGRSCNRYYDTCSSLLEVRNLRTRHSVALLTGVSTVTDIVLRSNGSVAAIATDAAGTPQVWAIDRLGKRVLDPGPDVQPGTLALAGGKVYWMRGQTPVAADLA
jgi:hypothetical protein